MINSQVRLVASALALVLWPLSVEADLLKETYAQFDRFYESSTDFTPDVQQAQLSSPWVDSFKITDPSQTEFAVTVNNCQTFLAGRRAGFEPDAPDEWPTYRGYGLRCLALQEIAFLQASPDLQADTDAPKLDLVSDFPLAVMLAEDSLDLTPITLRSIPMEGLSTVFDTDTDQVTIQLLGSFSLDGVAGAVLLVLVEAGSLEGSYSTATLFRLDRGQGSTPYSVARRIEARVDSDAK